jgi:hypothetical protein
MTVGTPGPPISSNQSLQIGGNCWSSELQEHWVTWRWELLVQRVTGTLRDITMGTAGPASYRNTEGHDGGNCWSSELQEHWGTWGWKLLVQQVTGTLRDMRVGTASPASYRKTVYLPALSKYGVNVVRRRRQLLKNSTSQPYTLELFAYAANGAGSLQICLVGGRRISIAILASKRTPVKYSTHSCVYAFWRAVWNGDVSGKYTYVRTYVHTHVST